MVQMRMVRPNRISRFPVGVRKLTPQGSGFKEVDDEYGILGSQILLALMFLLHGRLMLFPPTSLQPGMAYIMAIPPGFRSFIGVAELLAGIGLFLPVVTGILSWPTPLAAVGLVIVMVGAVRFHISRKEYPNIVFNLILLALAVVVAYGRSVVEPF